MRRAIHLTLVIAGLALGEACWVEPILPPEARANYGWRAVTVPAGELRQVRQASFAGLPNFLYSDESYTLPSEDVFQRDLRFRLAPLVGFEVVSVTGGTRSRGFGFVFVPGITQIRVVSAVEIEVNNLSDLLTLNTGTPDAIAVVGRDTAAFDFDFPEDTPESARRRSPGEDSELRYFECLAPGGEELVGWRPGYSDELKCLLTSG